MKWRAIKSALFQKVFYSYKPNRPSGTVGIRQFLAAHHVLLPEKPFSAELFVCGECPVRIPRAVGHDRNLKRSPLTFEPAPMINQILTAHQRAVGHALTDDSRTP